MDRRWSRVAAAALIAIAMAAGCTAEKLARPSTSTSAKEAQMRLVSSAFSDGAAIPVRHARAGGDVSPPLDWSGAPASTRSFVLTCVDLHPVANGWVHWLVVDVPADVSALAADASRKGMPAGSRQLPTSYGSAGWGGPQPPPGSGVHTYRFTLYALDVPSLGVGNTATERDVMSAAEGHVLASGTLAGTYVQ